MVFMYDPFELIRKCAILLKVADDSTKTREQVFEEFVTDIEKNPAYAVISAIGIAIIAPLFLIVFFCLGVWAILQMFGLLLCSALRAKNLAWKICAAIEKIGSRNNQ